MDIDYLVDRLEALITSGKRVPLSNKVMVDEQECLDIIDQMRTVVPEEVRAAKRTLLDRERILDDADGEAHQIIEQAEQERQIMLEHEGLLAEGERQRQIIISNATAEAYEIRANAESLYNEVNAESQRMREDSNHYAMQVLKELDNLLSKHSSTVRNGLQAFEQQANQYQQQIEEYQRHNRPDFQAKDRVENSAPPRRPPTNSNLNPTLANSNDSNRPRSGSNNAAPGAARPNNNNNVAPAGAANAGNTRSLNAVPKPRNPDADNSNPNPSSARPKF